MISWLRSSRPCIASVSLFAGTTGAALSAGGAAAYTAINVATNGGTIDAIAMNDGTIDFSIVSAS